MLAEAVARVGRRPDMHLDEIEAHHLGVERVCRSCIASGQSNVVEPHRKSLAQ